MTAHWQDVLGHIRLLGPDIETFREDVKFINDYIEKLERAAEVMARAALAAPDPLQESLDDSGDRR